jgi:hypothetical protein
VQLETRDVFDLRLSEKGGILGSVIFGAAIALIGGIETKYQIPRHAHHTFSCGKLSDKAHCSQNPSD